MATGLFGAPIGMRGTLLGGGQSRGILPGDRPDMSQQMPTALMPQKKPGLGTRLLGQGWEGKIAALGGLLRGDPNAITNYQAMQQQQAEQAAELRQASLDRENDWQDWVRQQQWERANPIPAKDDAFDRALAGAGIDPNSEQARALYRQRAEALANPVQWVTGEDGIPRPLPRAAPVAPVGRLTPIEEGTGSNAGGNFPGR